MVILLLMPCWKDILPENSNIDRIEQLSQDAAGAFETMDSYCIDGAWRVEFVHFDDLDFVFAYYLAGWNKSIVCNDYRSNINDLSNYGISDDFVSKYVADDFINFDYLVVEE